MSAIDIDAASEEKKNDPMKRLYPDGDAKKSKLEHSAKLWMVVIDAMKTASLRSVNDGHGHPLRCSRRITQREAALQITRRARRQRERAGGGEL